MSNIYSMWFDLLSGTRLGYIGETDGGSSLPGVVFFKTQAYAVVENRGTGMALETIAIYGNDYCCTENVSVSKLPFYLPATTTLHG